MELIKKQEELARLTNEINMFESEKVIRELILKTAKEIDTKLGEIAKGSKNANQANANQAKANQAIALMTTLKVNINKLQSRLSLGKDDNNLLRIAKNNMIEYIDTIWQNKGRLKSIYDGKPPPKGLSKGPTIGRMITNTFRESNLLKIENDIARLKYEIDAMKSLSKRESTAYINSSTNLSSITKYTHSPKSNITRSTRQPTITTLTNTLNSTKNVNPIPVKETIRNTYPVYNIDRKQAISMAINHPYKYILRVASNSTIKHRPSAKYVATRFTKDDSPISHQIIKTIPNNGTIVDVDGHLIPDAEIYNGTSGGRFSARKTRKTNRTRKSVKK